MAHVNPVFVAKVLDVGLGFTRQLIVEGLTPWQEAIDQLAPSCRFMGAPCKPSDDEATTRGMVDALAASTRSAYCIAMLGPNEPNDSNFPWGGQLNTLKQQYWIWDEAHSVSWPHRGGGGAGVNRPPIWTCALKRNFNHSDDPTGHRYDDNIADLAAQTYNPGSGPISMGDVCDGIDHHQYWGDNSAGDRTNGQDTYGNVPPSITLSPIDGKCSLTDYEIGLAQQLAPGKPVLARSEFGHEDQGGNAGHALLDQETFLRLYQRGIYGCAYEFLDEGPSNPNGSGNWFGMYNLTDDPKPLYALAKTLCGYQASGPSFQDVAGFAPIGGNPLDTVPLVLRRESGGWDVYILWEARTSTDVICLPGHHIVGRSRTSLDSFGNKHYSVNAGDDTMTVLQVV